MTITDLSGLYVAYTQYENFRILVAATDEHEANELARQYFDDAGIMYASVDISEFTDVNTKFDCDYVISKQ